MIPKMLYQLFKKVCSYVYEEMAKQKAATNLLLPTTCTVYVDVCMCISVFVSVTHSQRGGRKDREGDYSINHGNAVNQNICLNTNIFATGHSACELPG